MNCLLEKEVSELRAEFDESRKDLGIITEYLKKKSANTSEKPNRKTLLNSTKISAKLDISKGGSKDSFAVNSR